MKSYISQACFGNFLYMKTIQSIAKGLKSTEEVVQLHKNSIGSKIPDVICSRRLKNWGRDTLWRSDMWYDVLQPETAPRAQFSEAFYRKWKNTRLPFWTTESRGWWNLGRWPKVIVRELWIRTCEVGVVWGIDEIVREGLRHIFIQIQFLRWNDSIFFSTQIAHKAIHWYLSWRK